MRSVSALLALARWQNGLLAALGVLAGAWWVAGGDAFGARTALAALAAVFLAAFANAINDWYDRDIDRTAHPERPLPSGALRPRQALAVAGVAAVLALAAASLSRFAMGAASAGILLLMVEYSRSLKRRGLPGNVVVALLASLPFVFGAWSVGRPGGALGLYLLAVPLHLAREIAKDLDDMAGDAPARRTLPLTVGVTGARAAMLAALAAFVAVLLPWAVRRPLFGLLVAPAVLLCAAAARRSLTGRPGGPLLLKSAMLCAMASLLGARAL
jgi:geranylgeranylglycerol-phosphate geranylgeranyltransferase